MPPERQPDSLFSGALLVDEHGRYLMQLRDDIPTILNPGHWGMFGGHVEEGETPFDGMMRELDEEIGHVPADLAFWRAFRMPLHRPGVADPILAEIHVFLGSIEAAQVPGLVQTEGAGRALFPAFAFLIEPKVSRVGLVSVALHAQGTLFAAGKPLEHWPT